jgi:hypothetical protein
MWAPMVKTAINSNLLFSDQYIEILLHVSKENRKNKVIAIDYSILIEKDNTAFAKRTRNKVIKQKLTTYQVKKLLILIAKLKPIIRTNADSEVEYDLQVKSKGNGYENINLRNRWTTRPQAMRDMFERTFWYKEPHQKLSDYIEKLK